MAFGNRVWGNETVLTYLKTGEYNYWVPLGRKIHYKACARIICSMYRMWSNF